MPLLLLPRPPPAASLLLLCPRPALPPFLQCRQRKLRLRPVRFARRASVKKDTDSKEKAKLMFPDIEIPDEPNFAELYADFLDNRTPLTEEERAEMNRKFWDQGWAPWEEILTPEAQFARASIDEGDDDEDIILKTPEGIEAFHMLRASYRQRKMEESGMSEDEWLREQHRIYEEVPDPVETFCEGPAVLRPVPPRDWPPPGWEVDRKELAYMRQAHPKLSERVDLRAEVRTDTENMSMERYKLFVKQYKVWAAANRTRLEEESYKFDQDYYPGRRKRGKDYNKNMLELPFYYPGQICIGKVTTLHLYQGAFIDIGCVHDGWVPIAGNDWYWIRHIIKIEMPVVVEVLAKRDPYRFRFPLELRFVDPNIDHLIFNRFEYPPIFYREEDKNREELWRSAGRLPLPRKKKVRERLVNDMLLSEHPFAGKLWQIHNAEQMILDDEEQNPEKYKNKECAEAMMNDDFDEENSVEYTTDYFNGVLIPKLIININPKELDMEAARAERQLIRNLMKQASEKGKFYKVNKFRRNIEMDEYDFMHWRRSVEEREALHRDISCRIALGLPLEEPGRARDKKFWKHFYDPKAPEYRPAFRSRGKKKIGASKVKETISSSEDEDDDDDEYDDEDFNFNRLRRPVLGKGRRLLWKSKSGRLKKMIPISKLRKLRKFQKLQKLRAAANRLKSGETGAAANRSKSG